MLHTIFEFLKILTLCFTAIVIVTIALLAMPHSRLRDFVLEVVKRLGASSGALIYLVSPVDLIPDFIPGVGQLDDLAVLAFAAYYWYTLFKGMAHKRIGYVFGRYRINSNSKSYRLAVPHLSGIGLPIHRVRAFEHFSFTATLPELRGRRSVALSGERENKSCLGSGNVIWAGAKILA